MQEMRRKTAVATLEQSLLLPLLPTAARKHTKSKISLGYHNGHSTPKTTYPMGCVMFNPPPRCPVPAQPATLIPRSTSILTPVIFLRKKLGELDIWRLLRWPEKKQKVALAADFSVWIYTGCQQQGSEVTVMKLLRHLVKPQISRQL